VKVVAHNAESNCFGKIYSAQAFDQIQQKILFIYIWVSLQLYGDDLVKPISCTGGYFFNQGGIFSGFFCGGVDGFRDGGLDYCGICGVNHSGTQQQAKCWQQR